MNEAMLTPEVTRGVHDLVAGYVYRKTEAKSGIKWEDFKDKKVKDPDTGQERTAVPEPYREARQKVCSDAFLRLRSFKSREDFVTFFAGTICSVPQFLPVEKYEEFARLLVHGDNWIDVKALAMLALSGLSRV